MFVPNECHHYFFFRHQNTPGPIDFIVTLFNVKKDIFDEKKYKHAMIALHGASITEKSQIVQVLSSGYVNFIKVYDIMNGFIFVSEFDENKNHICHMSQSHFPTAESLENFFHDLGVLFVSCLSIGAVWTESMLTHYSRPVKKLLADYHANHPPPAPFIWLNLYFEKIRSEIFSMDNLLHMFVTPEGQGVWPLHGLHIGKYLIVWWEG